MKVARLGVSLYLLLSLPVFCVANPAGSLDGSFNVGLGSSYGENMVLMESDGKVIIAGDFTSYKSVTRKGIARLNSDASLDFSFDATNNVVGSSLHGIDAGALLPGGQILVAGGFSAASGANRNRIARLNSDGSLDPTFDPGAGPNGDVDCFAIQPDGKIIIGGAFTSVAGQPRGYIARLNSDGTLDTNFLASADYLVEALALQPDGKIIVAGWFFHLDGTSPPNIARLNSDGTLDTAFVSSISAPVERIALQTDGRILLGSDFTFQPGLSGTCLARLLPNGSWDAGFSANVNISVKSIQLQNDGRILIGGHFSSVNGAGKSFMARLYRDGSIDNSFNSGTDNEVDAIAIQPNGRLVIAGGFADVEGTLEEGLARLFGDDPTAAPIVQINGQAFQGFESDPSISIQVIRSYNTNMAVAVEYGTADIEARAGSDYVATSGVLNFVPGEVVKTVAIPLINDSQVESLEHFRFFLTNAMGGFLGALTNATVTIVDDDSIVQISSADIVTNELAGVLSVTVARNGTNVASSVLCQTVGGTAVAGADFINLAQTVSFAAGDSSKAVLITLLDDTQVEPDKTFSVQLSNPANTQIGARSNLTVTILDNDAPGYPGFGLNGSVNSVTPSGDGELVLGGSFISINGVARNRIGKVFADASLDQNFDPGTGADDSILAVAVQPDGKIICGGSFVWYNGVKCSHLMRLNVDGSLDPTFDPGVGADGSVSSLALATNGAVFAGGSFRNFEGVSRNGIVKLNGNGSVDTSFVPQTSSLMLPVRDLALQADGRILLGPATHYGQVTNICIRLNGDGSVDTNLNTTTVINFFGTYCSTIVPQQNGKILVGGSFTIVDGLALNNIARLNQDGSVDTSFNPGAGANGPVTRLLALDSGKIMAVGAFTTYAGVARNRIARINGDGSIDLTFDPGLGADAAISDIALLRGNGLAIGGSFRSFNGFPRYSFAILGPDGPLVTRLRFESFAWSNSIAYSGCLIEPEKPFQIQSSSNLTDWHTIYSNSIHQSFTSLPLPATNQDRQFYRLLQSH